MIAGEFSQPVGVCVMGDLSEPKLPAERLKVSIVRVRQCQRKIHVAAAAQPNFRFFGDNSFAQRCKRDRQLNGRAGLGTTRKRQFLINHGEDAAAGRLNCHHRTIHVAKSVNCGLAHDWIFARSGVTVSNVTRK